MTFGIFDIERRAMSIYGYCRISTAKQSIDRQVRNIRAEYPTAHIVQEAYTGTSILRPEWSKLYRILKEGDKGFIKPQSEYPDAYTDTFYISQKLSNSTGNSILDVLNDAFSDGSSEWVGYKGGFFSYNDDACVLVTAKGMSFSESGDYSLTYVESGKTTTLTDSRGFEQEADIYYAYNTDEFSEAYENLNTVDNEIADESSLIFEFLIGNENYTDWQ